jgi:plasmid maintenance system antidote protein VapI
METMAEYVIRKLTEPHTNISAICNTLKLNRSRAYRLIKDKRSANNEFVQTLNDYFKRLGE